MGRSNNITKCKQNFHRHQTYLCLLQVNLFENRENIIREIHTYEYMDSSSSRTPKMISNRFLRVYTLFLVGV